MVPSCLMDTLVSRNGIDGESPVWSRLNLMVGWNWLRAWWNCVRLARLCCQIPKISSIHQPQKASDLGDILKNLVSKSCMNNMAKGGASLFPIATPTFCLKTLSSNQK